MHGKILVILFSILVALPAQARIACRVQVDGQTARPSSGSAGTVFVQNRVSVYVEKVPDKPNRLQFTVVGAHPTKAAYVIAGFYEGRLQARPEINGQQLTFTCLQK